MSDDKLELDIWQALRLIAERTSFQTEEQQTAVLATIDKHAADDEGEVPTAEDVAEEHAAETRDERRERLRAELAELEDDEPEAKSNASATPEPSHSAGVKAAPEAKFSLGRETGKVTSAPAKKSTSPARGRRA